MMKIFNHKNMTSDEFMSQFHFKKFGKENRSSFSYWYNHWKAFNLVAIYYNAWKFKYLFHDFEKPWLKLFKDYKEVQRIHRHNNAHHLEYKGAPNYDWDAMAIDWECSRYTKNAAPLTARQEARRKITSGHPKSDELKANFFKACDKLGF